MRIETTHIRKAWGRQACGINSEKSLEDFLKEVKEVKIVKKCRTTDNQRCAWFVFKDEPWYGDYDDYELEVSLLFNGIKFLSKHGYSTIKRPRKSDIVMYCEDNGVVNHYGFYESNNLVTSKIGVLSVIQHPISLVPDFYGNNITFMRKL